MKRKLWWVAVIIIEVCILFVGAAIAKPRGVSVPRVTLEHFPQTSQQQRVLSFEFNFTADPACPTPTSLNCVRGFEHWEYQAGIPQRVSIIALPANPVGTSVTVSNPLVVAPGYGPRTAFVIAVAADDSGGRVESDPSPFGYPRKPGSPVNPKVQP